MKTAVRPTMYLRDIPHVFCVSFGIRPIYASIGGDGPETGFEMELIGSHQFSARHIQGHCAACQRVLLGLLELADHCLREEEAHALHIRTRCEKTVEFTSSGSDWPEVVLRITAIRKMSLEDVTADRLTQLDRLLQLTENLKTEFRGLGCTEDAFDRMPVVLPPRLNTSVGEPSFV